jgi:hypothetical protein
MIGALYGKQNDEKQIRLKFCGNFPVGRPRSRVSVGTVTWSER